MNTTADGTEPLGEAPDVTMLQIVSLIDRQTQALKEIRLNCEWIFDERHRHHKGVRQAAATILGICNELEV